MSEWTGLVVMTLALMTVMAFGMLRTYVAGRTPLAHRTTGFEDRAPIDAARRGYARQLHDMRGR